MNRAIHTNLGRTFLLGILLFAAIVVAYLGHAYTESTRHTGTSTEQPAGPVLDTPTASPTADPATSSTPAAPPVTTTTPPAPPAESTTQAEATPVDPPADTPTGTLEPTATYRTTTPADPPTQETTTPVCHAGPTCPGAMPQG